VKILVIEAKENLTKYVEMVRCGVEVIISSNDVSACKMAGIHQATTKRFGLLQGKVTIPDDFDHHNQGILEMFYRNEDL